MDEPLYPEYQEMPELFTGAGPARPVRYRIDPTTGQSSPLAVWSKEGKARLAEATVAERPGLPARVAAFVGR